MHVTLVTESVGTVDLIQDGDGVADMVVHKISSDVGLVTLSLSESLYWAYNILVHTGEINALCAWRRIWLDLQGGTSNRINMFIFPICG